MRSILPAVLGCASFAMIPPASLHAAPPGMVMLCTAQGVRYIPAPPGMPNRRDKECGKPCHALCQRKRVTHDDGHGGEDPPD